MTNDVEVAIVGAGPYGLSVAAHLRGLGVDSAIFGRPMQTWQARMLRDSHLKSDGFATNLYEPAGDFTLRCFCEREGLPYSDLGMPVPRTTFVSYALAFQRRFVADLDQCDVALLERAETGFLLQLEDGRTVRARSVIVAAGIGCFDYVPEMLARLSPKFGSHSSAHHTVERFTGADVLIVGAGASALDLAAALVGVARRIRVVARQRVIRFGTPPRPRSALDKLRAPKSGLGPGWKSRFCTDAPLLFHSMPERVRVEVVRQHLGPAPCWFTRDLVAGNVEFVLGQTPVDASVQEGRAHLVLAGETGAVRRLDTDHIIAATGYRVDLGRLRFLSDEIHASLRRTGGAPQLSRNFESSVSGLFFAGPAAANSFGPLLRFAFGAKFTAARICRHFASPRGRQIWLRNAQSPPAAS